MEIKLKTMEQLISDGIVKREAVEVVGPIDWSLVPKGTVIVYDDVLRVFLRLEHDKIWGIGYGRAYEGGDECTFCNSDCRLYSDDAKYHKKTLKTTAEWLGLEEKEWHTSSLMISHGLTRKDGSTVFVSTDWVAETRQTFKKGQAVLVWDSYNVKYKRVRVFSHINDQGLFTIEEDGKQKYSYTNCEAFDVH